MASRSSTDLARIVAQNFIKTYGRTKFLRLVEMLQNNEPGPKIAHEFDVSRQRVHQWRLQLGQETVTYVLNSAVETIVGTVQQSRKMV